MKRSKDHHPKWAEASFKKPAPTQAELAKADEEEAAKARRDKTARLRPQRLAKEAADKKIASDDPVGEVQSVQTSSGQRGFGFIFRANDGRWISLCYETQEEAERARESIRAAVQNAIAVEMDRG